MQRQGAAWGTVVISSQNSLCLLGHMLLPTAGNTGEQIRPKLIRVWEEAAHSDAPP